MPMISAMIVITTKSSTSVKPRSPRAAFPRFRSSQFETRRMQATILSDDLADGQKRRHHRHDEPAHNDADGDDRRGSGNSDDTIETALELRLVELGDPGGEHRQLTRLFAQT